MTTTPTRRTHAAKIALVAASLAIATITVAGCSSSTPNNPTSSAGVDRSDPKAVANAFATAWAGGDLTTACSYTSGSEKAELMRQNLCAGTAGWHETPTLAGECATNFGGLGSAFVYRTNAPVNRFEKFITVVTKGTDDTYAVTVLSEPSSSEGNVFCADPGTSLSAPTSGGH